MSKKSTQKENNFKRISENRVDKILTLLEQMKNLTNKSFYDYSNEDVEKIFDVLEGEMKETKKVLIERNKGKKKRFEL